jgi:hypothetical protein
LSALIRLFRTKIGAATILAILTLLLTSSVINNALTLFVAGYNSPNFQVTSGPDLSSVSIQNIGHAAAHNVRIMILLQGKQSIVLFSTENGSMQTSYNDGSNYTAMTVELSRMSEQAEVIVFFKPNSATLRIWVQSDEKGTYTVLPSADPLHQVLDLVRNLTTNPTQVFQQFSSQLISFSSISFVVIFIGLLILVRWVLKNRGTKGLIWPFE